ncbi:MAG: CocE/NonD family hydrolase, partial [Candidatus Acidiferrales bacterium]
PEGLQCISPGMTAGDLYHGWFYHAGVLRLASTLGWGIQLLKVDARRKKLREASDRLERAWANPAAQTSVLPFAENPALHGEGLPRYVLDWFEHDQPGDYWASLDISRAYERICVPALHISGWYDLFLRGSVDGFLNLRRSAATQFARDHQYLIAGPWVHIPWGDRIGTANFGPEALLDTDEILLRWFDHWLKDSGSFSREPRVRHFVLGENHWREAAAFPGDADYALFLHSGGGANSRKGDGALSPKPPSTEEPPDLFIHDPEVPVTAPGGPAALSGAFDQAALEQGKHLLVYSTEPLSDPMWIFGTPRIVLHAATSANHADFVAKLVRARHDGSVDFISMGAARSGYLFRESGYSADKVHTWNFPLDPVSCRFDRGDRIRIEIASSAFPLYDR